MLQNIRAKLFSSTTTNMADEPPRILVEISTSSSTLSKSGNPPFTITLNARVDGSRPITIETFQTVLFSRAAALDYQGLTFKDTTSGTLAKRRVIDVQYRVPDNLTATSDSVVEIPPKDDDSRPPYTEQHTFQTPAPEQRASEAPTLSSEHTKMSATADDLMTTMSDQTVGLQVGKTYEIGLGNDMSQVSWWRPGSKAEVFAQGPVRRRAAERPKLNLELVKTVTFNVVE